jgi:hypothetical protein
VASCPAQIAVGELEAEIEGIGLTVMAMVLCAAQPAALVPVNV